MWKLFKAEFRYHKIAITAAYAFGILFLLATVLSDLLQRMDSPMATWSLMSVVTTGYIFLLIYIGNHDETEKRDRLHALLPLSQRKLGVARMVLLLLFQAGFALIGLAGVMAAGKGRDPAYLYYMLSSNAFFFLIIALVAIYLDLGHFGRNTYRRIYAGLVALLVILIAWLTLTGTIIPALEYIFEPYTTPAGAAIFVLLAAGLFCLDMVIYTRRKSYLQ
jgi:quinol-cytochrome oxidoreductase complex cytochrome b subunit